MGRKYIVRLDSYMWTRAASLTRPTNPVASGAEGQSGGDLAAVRLPDATPTNDTRVPTDDRRSFTIQSQHDANRTQLKETIFGLSSLPHNPMLAQCTNKANGNSCFNAVQTQRFAEALEKTGDNYSQIIRLLMTGKITAENASAELFPNCNNNMTCVLKKIGTKDEQLTHAIVAQGPANTNEWFITYQITDALKRLQFISNEFYSVGTFPANFFHLWGKDINGHERFFTEHSLSSLPSHVRHIGFVFNTAASYEPGKHWVALAVLKLDNKVQVIYFDSGSSQPSSDVLALMDMYCDEAKSLGWTSQKIINAKRHQYGKTECGMYSVFFHALLHTCNSFEEFDQLTYSDEMMFSMRHIFFTDPTLPY